MSDESAGEISLTKLAAALFIPPQNVRNILASERDIEKLKEILDFIKSTDREVAFQGRKVAKTQFTLNYILFLIEQNLKNNKDPILKKVDPVGFLRKAFLSLEIIENVTVRGGNAQ